MKNLVSFEGTAAPSRAPLRQAIACVCAGIALLAAVWPAWADAPVNYEERYRRAAAIEASIHDKWLLNNTVTPHWIGNKDGFWYKKQTQAGHRFVFVDAVNGASRDLFDHQQMAASLSAAAKADVKADDLQLTTMRFDDKGLLSSFDALGKSWRVEASGTLQPATGDPNVAVSPDRKFAVYSRDNNLWVRELATNKERALTTDGQPTYAYAQAPAATGRRIAPPRVIWSPDSRKLVTVLTDDRNVGLWPLIDFAPKNGFRPVANAVRVALPGDANIPTFQLVIIDVDTGKKTAVRYPPIASIRMYDTPIDGRTWWSADGKRLIFIDIDRGEKVAHVMVADAATGVPRELFREAADTPVEIGSNVYTQPSLAYLPNSDQLVWFSQRSGSAHLYLYDMRDGKLVRPLTQGAWRVRDLLAVDEARRDILVSIAGREPGKNPYQREIARVNLDSGRMTVLSKSDADHAVASKSDMTYRSSLITDGSDPMGWGGVAPSGNFFVETLQRPDRPGVTDLRDRDGRRIATVETADASRMPKQFRWPEPVKALAADGKTDLRAVVFYPSDFDPKGSYPVVDFVYGGPQVSYVPKAFGDSAFVSAAALAETGFVVVMVDGRGTALRDRAFETFSYGHLQDASFVDDHIAAIREIARDRPALDLTRVGITGFSGGGYMTAMSMMRHSDFYKVGVAGSGNYDQRLFWHTWGERYQGLLDGQNYEEQAVSKHVANLKGKLLLYHGAQDSGVHPSNFFQLVQALTDANKDFDMLMSPRNEHATGGYLTRRRWDYFVRNLAGAEPPKEFALKSSDDYIIEALGARAKRMDTDRIEAK